MKQKWLWGMVPIVAACTGLAGCHPSTTENPGPATAFALVRLTTTGAPDNTFGGDGIVTTEPDPALFDFALAAAIQSDGKILAAGSTGLAGQGSIAVVRYSGVDGSRDTGFGTAGIVRTLLPSLASSAQAIAIQPADGKIVVAALTFTAVSSDNTTATTGIALLRYNTDGTPDTGFGTGGIVTAPIGPGTTSDTCSLALQGTNIVVAGASSNGHVFLYRYTASGVLDTTFGPGATGVTDIPLGTPALSPAIALQSDNKIVLAGGQGSFSTSNQPVDQVVVRYNTDGSLDTTTFNPSGAVSGQPGVVVTDINLLGNYGNAVAIQADGKIVVAGHANVDFAAGASDISLVRYNTDGSLDTTLTGPAGNPNPGIVTTNLGLFENALSVALQADGKIVVAGNSGSGGFTQTIVLRYKPDGTADTSFGVSGVVVPPLVGPSNIASGNAVLVQSDGKIVVAGYD